MPWSSGAAFAAKHNKKLKGAAANKAKSMAEAMIRGGTDEGIAIATANKHGNKMQRRKGGVRRGNTPFHRASQGPNM